MYEYIRATFPNAVIVQSYNSSEVEDAHIGMPCKPMDGSEPLAVYHEKATHHLELLDPSTGNTLKPESGAEGDLLVTAYPGEPSSFPLVRFRIGDTVRVVEERCAHGSWSFTVLGRTDMDFLKIPGGVLRADEIERVLRTMPEIVTDRFELHCTETGSPHGPRIAPVLMVEPLSEAADVAALAAPLAELIRVSPQMSYADGVRAGRYASLRCEPLKSPRSGKTKRMVRS
jgi:phenylacetate-coenzyme A ligase PaaK-like adenylate-forming protein